MKILFNLILLPLLLIGCVTVSPINSVPMHPKGLTPEEARAIYNAQMNVDQSDYPYSISNRSEAESRTKPVLYPKQKSPRSTPAPSSKRTNTGSTPLKCGSYPRTCGQMKSCSQARQALQCGMHSLDRDDDGIPCEKICG